MVSNVKSALRLVRRRMGLLLLLLGLSGLGACTPAYQLSKLSDGTDGNYNVPKLAKRQLGFFYFSDLPRKQIIQNALKLYNVDFSQVHLAVNCNAEIETIQTKTTNSTKTTTTTISDAPEIPPDSKTKSQCVMAPGVSSGEGIPFVPTAVAAVINAAADECVFWTYQEDTTSLNLSTLSVLAGMGVLGAGILGSVAGWSAVTNTALSTSGAGVTLVGGLGKVGQTPSQASVIGVVTAGLDYYPLILSKATALADSEHTPTYDWQPSQDWTVAALSALWDAAGTGCAAGILKGHSRWLN